MDLFEYKNDSDASTKHIPLAEKMRPQTLSDFMGQEHLVGPDAPLPKLLAKDNLPSIIFWGPPGTGKTTLAHLIAKMTQKKFHFFSAVLQGVNELRKIIAEAISDQKYYSKATIIFIDEIHRFNKSQQDALLPYVENGSFTLIGATTENPSFELIAPLLSRCRVFTLNPLNQDHLQKLIDRVLSLNAKIITIDPVASTALIDYANGDARRLLNSLDVIINLLAPDENKITLQHIATALQTKTLLYDKGGEEHYNTISAFIKSMRGSDPDAALYYLARMLEAGEEPRFIARRMVIFASEDIGNADPQALVTAVAAFNAYEIVGTAEGWIPLAQAATYLASAPKGNASYAAYKEAKADVMQLGNLPIPLHLRNAPTALMKNLDYGKGYIYPHDHGVAGRKIQQYLPDQIKNKKYYQSK